MGRARSHQEDCFSTVVGRHRGSARESTHSEVNFQPLLVVESAGTTLISAKWDWTNSLQGEVLGDELALDENTYAARIAKTFVARVLAPTLTLALAEVGAGAGAGAGAGGEITVALVTPLLSVHLADERVIAAAFDWEDSLEVHSFDEDLIGENEVAYTHACTVVEPLLAPMDTALASAL